MNRIGLAVGIACGLVAGSMSAPTARAQPEPAYRLTKAVPLGAPDRWDYVVFDPGSHRVYVAHGDRVAVVDGRDGTVLGVVDGIPGGTHGIAISAATGKGYTDDGKAGVAVAFDLQTLKVKSRIPVDADADAIVLDAVTGHVFVIEGDPAKIAVIDPRTDVVIAKIDGGGKLEYAVSDDRGSVYVNGEANREILRVNTRTNAVDAHWPIPGCASPHGLAIDTAAHRLFSSCVNGVLVVVDSDTGATIATVPIGKGSDAAAFDPRRNIAFSSNGSDGTVSVIHEKDAATFVPAAPLTTAVSGRTMAIDPETGRLFIAAADVDASSTPGGRPRPRPGSLKLLFLDPVP
jgi:DNA-binding beta-propeller fold protein YncE